MIPRTPKIRLIQNRLRTLHAGIAKLESEIAKLKEQAKKLEIAEEIFLELENEEDDLPLEGATKTIETEEDLKQCLR